VTLEQVVARCAAENRAALIGYLPAGFPDTATAIAAMEAMVAGGVDIVEVGLPYSDPLMDGPVIQAAVEAALAAGVTTSDVIAAAGAVAATGAVGLVMSYYNPLERYGLQRFADELAAAGGSGVITPDLTPEEGGPWIAAAGAAGLDRVFLVAPSSTEPRLRLVAGTATGFIYAASTMGVTGARSQVGSRAAELVARTKAVTGTPVCVGLGVSTAAQAAEIAAFADGVIVGSAFVQRLLDDPGPGGVAAVGRLAADLAAGVRRG
jgi:tryptophan synthase alpha chain